MSIGSVSYHVGQKRLQRYFGLLNDRSLLDHDGFGSHRLHHGRALHERCDLRSASIHSLLQSVFPGVRQLNRSLHHAAIVRLS